MILLLILIITEILTIVVLQQHFYHFSRTIHFISIIVHVILSLWLWIFFFELSFYNSFYDNPEHVWLMMNLTGMFVAIVFPRIILIMMHFTGRLLKLRSGNHLRWLTNLGMVFMFVILIVIGLSTFYERFNFTTEEITIKIKRLNKDLDGLRIVQLSDMHLSSFYHHKKELQDVILKVNKLKPDFLINTGDFVTFGWREFERYRSEE